MSRFNPEVNARRMQASSAWSTLREGGATSSPNNKRVREYAVTGTKRRASQRHRHWRLRTYLAERRRRANWTERRRLPLAAALRVRSGGGRFRRRRGRPPRRRRRRRRRRSQQPWRDAEAAGAPSSLPHPLRPRLLVVSSRFNPPVLHRPSPPPGRAIPHYSIDPTGEALWCVPFAWFERRLQIALA